MKATDIPDFDESILQPVGTEVVRPVRTTPLHEFQFRDYCREKGVVSYLPLRRAWKIHNLNARGKSYNYSREVLRPMFTGYVFVKTPLERLRGLSEQILEGTVASGKAYVCELENGEVVFREKVDV